MNYYEILGIKEDATQDEIQASLRALTHAINTVTDVRHAKAIKSAKQIAKAYRVLSDPDRRKEYDMGRKWIAHEPAALSQVQAVTDSTFQTDVIEASKAEAVMLVFFAPWDVYSHAVLATFEEMARPGKLKLAKLDTSANRQSTETFNVRATPTVLTFRHGHEVDRLVGEVPRDQLEGADPEGRIPKRSAPISPPPSSRVSSGLDWGAVYRVGAAITGCIVFVGTWIYCAFAYGFLLGVGLGWLPSAIVAIIAALLWPLLALGLLALIIFVSVNK
ncbi:MAG: DnaJ domain-containing protein [Candidatus Acidiferrales bacterium]